MLINQEGKTKKYWTISAGKEGILEGVEQEELFEIALEIVSKLDDRQLMELHTAISNEWVNKSDEGDK
jgi:hypothetical protein